MPRNPLLESAAMPQPTLFRFLLLAALAVTAGFFALAIAVPIEPQVPAPLIALFSSVCFSLFASHRPTGG